MITRPAGFGDGLDLQLPGRPQGFYGTMDASGQRRTMDAAADLMGPGAIAIPMFQAEILDLVRRRGILGQRIQPVLATGQPSRYFEQTRIVEGVFQDPRGLNFTPNNDPTRRERYVTIKAIYGSIQFGLFDVEVTRQQGAFTYLLAKDINDTVNGCLKTSDRGLWNGTDTSLILPTSLQYVGAAQQINRTATIASTASIIDGLTAEVAALVANPDFTVRPTAIYINPILGNLIDQEERLNQRQIPQTVLNTVTGGLQVNAISTQAGSIPLIPDPLLFNGVAGGSTTESGKTDYAAYILMEELVELHYVTAPEPRVFQLGLQGSLATQYAVVYFAAPVFKGVANSALNQSVVESSTITYAHSRVIVVR
jgi:hypothetical protein